MEKDMYLMSDWVKERGVITDYIDDILSNIPKHDNNAPVTTNWGKNVSALCLRGIMMITYEVMSSSIYNGLPTNADINNHASEITRLYGEIFIQMKNNNYGSILDTMNRFFTHVLEIFDMYGTMVEGE